MRCKQISRQCEWDTQDDIQNVDSNFSPKNTKGTLLDENVYAEILKQEYKSRPQFICTTQPLASIVSRDSFLCFDGDTIGLYYPWRHSDHGAWESHVDRDLMDYLDKKGAFCVPPLEEQRHLIQLFLRNVYPFYPVTDKRDLEDTRNVPLLLLNSIFLSAFRFDDLLIEKGIRLRAKEFYRRCTLLELKEANKITLIQSYLLMSIQEEGLEGANNARSYVTKACNLCGELALTNINNFENDAMHNNQDAFHKGFSKISYGRNLLSRIFWVSFCCDRLSSATSAREMYYSQLDLMVDDITISCFDKEENQDEDFNVFFSWYSICCLVERIQCALYKPPSLRTPDFTLEEDLLNWTVCNSTTMDEKFSTYLKIYHAYACMLYFRHKVAPTNLIIDLESNEGREGELEPLNIKSIEFFHGYSKNIIDLTGSLRSAFHIMVVHAVLHVISLIQFEFEVDIKDAKWHETERGIFFNSIMVDSMAVLRKLKDYWWFAGAALKLCESQFFEVNS